MKQFKNLALALTVLCSLSFLNELKAQFMGSEVTIYNTTASPYFYGAQEVYDCSPTATFDFGWKQNQGTGVAYNGLSVPGYPIPVFWEHAVEVIHVYDAFGDFVTVGSPNTPYPSFAMFPSGDIVEFHYYGCNGHPSVIEIYQ